MPFARLPLLPLLKVLKNLDHVDLLHLSFCSRKMTQHVRTFNQTAPHSETRITSRKIGGRVYGIVLSIGQSWEYCIYLKLRPYQQLNPRPLQFRGYSMVISESGCRISCATTERFTALRELIIRHLLNLFRATPIKELILTPYNVRSDVFWKFGNILQSVKVEKPVGWQEPRHTLSVSDAKFLLEEVKTQSLEICVPIQETRFKYWKGFQTRKISIRHASWVSLDAVINSRSEEIELMNYRKITPSEFLNLVNLVIGEGKMRDLKKLTIGIGFDNNWATSFLGKVRKEMIVHTLFVRTPQFRYSHPKIEGEIRWVYGRRVNIQIVS